eukprot:TRINITY_DN9321_c0_g1_i1.p1 TRINITY_DN9321_c0_g1~~TRINITY_DN9321_c0_g1_i1.p1  ORF type:complete len:577 (-),score=142.34 TRINITY_DN9321_c0_g1_i1:327-2057(-)
MVLSSLKCTSGGGKRFSECVLWDMQKRFYEDFGPRAWTEGIVPSFITSNSFVAQQYADCILAVLATGNPVTVFDLGAGHGKLGFLILKSLCRVIKFVNDQNQLGNNNDDDNLDPFVSRLDSRMLKYVFIDISDKNLDFIAKHKSMEQFVHLGIIDFAKFDFASGLDGEANFESFTLRSGAILDPLRSMIVIANYFFDSLPQDVFKVTSQNSGECPRIYEGRLVSMINDLDPTYLDDGKISDVNFVWDFSNVVFGEERRSYYRNPKWDSVLSSYLREFHCSPDSEIFICFPVGVFSALDKLRTLGAKSPHFLMLVMDKGTMLTPLERKDSSEPPKVAVHGSISLHVDFDCVKRYCDLLKATSFFPIHRELTLKTSVLSFGNKKLSFQLSRCIQNLMDFSGVDFFTVQTQAFERLVDRQTTDVKVLSPGYAREVLTLLRLSSYDADIFFKFREVLLDLVDDSTPNEDNISLEEVFELVDRVSNTFYRLEDQKDIPFELGKLCYELDEFSMARQFFAMSLELYGEHHITEFNVGLTFFMEGFFKESIGYFEKSFSLNPDYLIAEEYVRKAKEHLSSKQT